MKKLLMLGTICALAFTGLNADESTTKTAPSKNDHRHHAWMKKLHNDHKHHAWMKKLHEEMKPKLEALDKTRGAIDAAVKNNDDKEAITQIYTFITEKHDIAKEFHDESKKHFEEMRKKHAGKGQDADLKKNQDAMKKTHADMKAKLEALDATLAAAKAAIDNGDLKTAVTKISEYLDQKHTLTKNFHENMKKRHGKMRKEQHGKGSDAKLKKQDNAKMEKLHADMKAKLAALDATRDAIKKAVGSGDVHGAVVAISQFIDEKHELTKEFHENMEKHHKAMHDKEIAASKTTVSGTGTETTEEVTTSARPK